MHFSFIRHALIQQFLDLEKFRCVGITAMKYMSLSNLPVLINIWEELWETSYTLCREILIFFGSWFPANVTSVQKFDLVIANFHALSVFEGHEDNIPTGAKSARGCQSEVENDRFFKIKSEILKFSKNDFGSLQQPFKTHKSQNKDFFAGRTIWSAELKIDFGIFGGQKT